MNLQKFSSILRLGGVMAFIGGVAFSVQSQTHSTYSAPYDETPTIMPTETLTPTATATATLIPTATPSPIGYCPIPPINFDILPLGDSLTAGLDSAAGSYRGYLLNKLNQRGFSFKYVGGQHGRGPLGPPSENDNHEGYPGSYTYHLSNLVEFGMNSFQPNVILLMAGTNDVLSNETPHAENVQNYNTLMEKVLTKWPGAHLVVAKIPRNKVEGKTEIMTALNADIENLAALRVAQGHKVYVVDMFAVIGPEDIYDLLHPNESGYQKIAEVWMKGLCAVAASLVPVTPTPTASPTPTVTPTPTAGPVFMSLVLNNLAITPEVTSTMTSTPVMTGTVATTSTPTATRRP